MRQIKILLSAVFLLSTLVALPLYAQSPSPKIGYLRFWNMLPPANGAFELSKAGAAEGQGALLNSSSYEYRSYAEEPAAKYRLAVFKKGDPKTPLKTFDVDLRPGSFFTVVVVPRGTVLDVEVLDDTSDPKADSGTLILRNYFPGLTVSTFSDKQKIGPDLAYGQSFVATGLPLARLPLTLSTRLPNGSPAESSAEADLRASKRGTLLIVPDSYGRFRPRTTIDGK